MIFRIACYTFHKVAQFGIVFCKFNAHNLKKAVPRLFLASNSIYGVTKAATEESNSSKVRGKVRAACAKAESSVTSLISVLSDCIQEISEEYEACIVKQIEVIRSATKLGPVGEHWDVLTEYRVKANELKQELVKYDEMVKVLEQMTYTQVVSSLLAGHLSGVDLINSQMKTLQELLDEVMRRCNYLEKQLLTVNIEAILEKELSKE